MKKIAIYGAGGFGREVHSIIEDINKKKNTFIFIGYFDDGVDKGTIINNFSVLGNIDDLNEWDEPIDLIIAVAIPKIKKNIAESIHNPYVGFPVLIHPSAIMGESRFNFIRGGTIICAGTIITVNVEIGCHVILNLGCTVGHDTKIGDYSSFMPSVNISGEVLIENCVYVGTGAKIINRLTVGEFCDIGAGAVITKSIPPNYLAVGMPARMAPKSLTVP